MSDDGKGYESEANVMASIFNAEAARPPYWDRDRGRGREPVPVCEFGTGRPEPDSNRIWPRPRPPATVAGLRLASIHDDAAGRIVRGQRNRDLVAEPRCGCGVAQFATRWART